MARSKDIATLETISGNLASVLGKTPEGAVGYIEGLLDEEGRIAEWSDISDRLEALEAVIVDQTFDSVSTNAQSGTAVEDAFKKHQVLQGATGTSYMANESNGGIIKFLASDGSFGKITAFDASDSEKTYIQICVSGGDNGKLVKLHFTQDGAYYKTGIGKVATTDNELVTKKDLKDISADLVTFKAHIDNADIHVTTKDKKNWNDKYTRAEVDAKLILKADITSLQEGLALKADKATTEAALDTKTDKKTVEESLSKKADKSTTEKQFTNLDSEIQALDNRLDTLEKKPSAVVDQTYNAKSKNAQSGLAVAEAISPLATKAEVTTHTSNQTIHLTADERTRWNTASIDVNTTKKTLQSHIDNNNIHVTSAQKSEWDAKLDKSAIKDLATKTEVSTKAEQADVNALMGRVTNLEKVTVDQTYNAKSKNAQSGLAVASAIKDLTTKAELSSHTANNNLHVTSAKKAEWDSKVSESQLAALKTELQQELDNKVSGVFHYKGSVATEAELPKSDQQVGDVYTVEDTGLSYAWSGTSWDKLSQSLGGFATKDEVLAHTTNQDIHVTTDNKKNWNDKYTKAEVDNKLSDATSRLDALESATVDQTYNSQSSNAQSGTAVADAFNQHITLTDIVGTSYLNNETSGAVLRYTKSNGDMGEVSLFDGSDGEKTYIKLDTNTKDNAQVVKIHVTTDGAYYSKAKSGLVATSDNELITKKDIKGVAKDSNLTAHTNNADIHVTSAKKAEWDAKLDTEDIADLATKAEVAEKAAQTDLDTLGGRVTALEEKPEPIIDQTYDAESTNAQSGTAVADAIKDLATKAEVSTKAEQTDLQALDTRVETLESKPEPVVDQAYNGESTNAQSGTAVAEAISPLATKAEITAQTETKAEQTEVDTLSGRVDALEAKPEVIVDQAYNAQSTNAQSGTAVADAILQQRTIENGGNVAYMSNETTGGVIKFTKSTGEFGKVTIYDGSDSERTYVQIVASNQDKSSLAKLNFTLTGAYYSKESSGSVAITDNELVTKKDIKDFATSSSVTDLGDRVTALEEKPEPIIDQTYDAESTNAQSGTAVADAIKDLADTTYVTDMIRKNTAHFRGSWETHADIPADSNLYPEDRDGNKIPKENDFLVVLRDETHEGHTWEYRYTGVWETNSVEGWKGVYEISDSPLTQEQLAALDSGITKELTQQIPTKASQSDLDTLSGRVDALEVKPEITVDQTYNGESTNAQSGTAVAEAVESLATKAELSTHTSDNSKHLGTISGENGASWIFNEGDGGGLRFTKTDGSGSLIAINDGTNNVYAQINAHTKDKAQIVRLNFNPEGIYYTKNAADNTVTADNELLTKADITDISDRVTALEEKPGITVDQTYDAESTNAQSGTAVAEAIISLATKEELSTHTGNSDIHVTAENKTGWNDKYTKSEVDSKVSDITNRLDTIESATVDQAYNAQSTNAQSGTAVADAFKQWQVVKGSVGTAYMANESNGGLFKFTTTEGSFGKVTVFDGSDGEQTFVQIVASNEDKSKLAKINFTLDGAYYSKTSGATALAENEILVKKDLTEVSSKISDYESHKANTDIHITAEEKTTFADKYTKIEVDDKLALKADKTELATKVDQGTIDSALAKKANQSYVDEELAKKANQQDVTDALELKADKGAIDEALASKVNQEDIDAALALKADQSFVVSELDKKADMKSLVSGLALKADKDTTERALKLKADTSLVESAIAGKADLDYVDTQIEELSERLGNVECVPPITVDQDYNYLSKNAQSGTAVAQAIALAPSKTQFNTHVNNTTVHITAAERTKWNALTGDAGEKMEAFQHHIDNAEIHVTELEKAQWDAKLGAEAISDLATQTEVDTLRGRVDALEALQATVTALQAKIAELESKVNGEP